MMIIYAMVKGVSNGLNRFVNYNKAHKDTNMNWRLATVACDAKCRGDYSYSQPPSGCIIGSDHRCITLLQLFFSLFFLLYSRYYIDERARTADGILGPSPGQWMKWQRQQSNRNRDGNRVYIGYMSIYAVYKSHIYILYIYGGMVSY